MTETDLITKLELCYPGLRDADYENIAREARGDDMLALRLARGVFLEMACWGGEGDPLLGEEEEIYRE